MTCIVGVVHKGKAFIGGDSAGMDDRYCLMLRSDKKIVRNGDFVIGFTSSFRMGQLLAYSFSPPVPRVGADLLAYMATDFVDVARSTMKAGGFARVTEQQDRGGTFLVGYRDRLFMIHEDFQVGEPAYGFAAVGCGDMVALGSLWSTRKWVNPTKRLAEALSASEAFCGGVRGPFFIEHTN